MATVNKDFKIKYGLVVEGTTGTINGNDILTKSAADQTYIIGLIGGSATSEATPDTVVLRDENADFSANAITVNTVNIGGAGSITDDEGDMVIDVTATGDDVIINADDIRLNSDDDVILNATGDVSLSATGGDILLQSPNIYAGENIGYTDAERVATRGYVDDVASDVTDHINATEAHGATGAVVGTTNTQTLENKTISYTNNTITVQVANVSDLTANASELNVLDGITASTSELNILDGVTADYTELNVLDGITATTAELNILDGVTADAQELNLLDGVTATTAELNILDGVTADYTEINILDGATVSTSELNVLDGITATTTELNYVDGVTSGIQGQLDDKAPLASPDLTGVPTAPTAAAGTNSTQIATTAYADAAVAAVVGAAPEMLDTLQELAAAMDNDPDLISNLNSVAAGKQDALTAGDNISIIDDVIAVTGLDTDDVSEGSNLYFSDSRAVDAVAANLGTGIVHSSEGAGNVFHIDESYLSTEITDGARAAVGVEFGGTPLTYDSANGIFGITFAADNSVGLDGSNGLKVNRDVVDEWYDAEGTAQGLVDALDTDDIEEGASNLYFTNQRAIDAVGGTIGDAIDLLDTDDIEEGSANLYFTDERAASAAATFFANASQTNIQISYNSGTGLLEIEAENGVADSTTDDLVEGSNNLYFQDSRAVDAIDGADITPQTVTIDSYRKEEATQTYFANATTATVHSFTAPYGSVKYLVRVVGTVSGTLHSQIVEILATVDGNNNVAVTEYGSIHTTEPALASFTVDYDGASESYRLRATSTGAMEVVVAATLLSWAD